MALILLMNDLCISLICDSVGLYFDNENFHVYLTSKFCFP